MSSASSSPARTAWAILFAFAIPTLILRRYLRRQCRTGLVQEIGERVLVLGGSSGIGRAIALQYAQRGAKVFIVGLRQAEVDKVYSECASLHPGEGNVIARVANFTDVQDMVDIRNTLKNLWNGVDTVLVCAGVSATRPLLEVAGVTNNADDDHEASAEGIQRTVNVANAAMKTNFTGPLVSAVTLVPLLESTSASPAILLIASLAAVVPAPTRSLYCSTKSAALILYQSLAIEHPKVSFSCALPSTVEGNFRASAVDGSANADLPPTRGLKREAVAKRCIEAIDNGENTFFIPAWYGALGHFVYWLCPAVTEWFAVRKYKFPQ